MARWLLVGVLLVLGPARAAAGHAEPGSQVENQQLPRLTGGTAKLLGDTTASVILFFRPAQEHSRQILKEMATCEKDWKGKSVHLTGVVSDKAAKAAVLQEMKDAGLGFAVLVDRGDALYGKLGVALHPVAVVVDKKHAVFAFQPFSKLNFCAVLDARVRFLLGEIDRQTLEKVIAPDAATERSDAALARRHYGMAASLFRLQKYDKALAEVKISLGKDATRAAAHTLLGKILAAKNDCPAAVKAFEQALKLDAKDAEAAEGAKKCRAGK